MLLQHFCLTCVFICSYNFYIFFQYLMRVNGIKMPFFSFLRLQFWLYSLISRKTRNTALLILFGLLLTGKSEDDNSRKQEAKQLNLRRSINLFDHMRSMAMFLSISHGANRGSTVKVTQLLVTNRANVWCLPEKLPGLWDEKSSRFSSSGPS